MEVKIGVQNVAREIVLESDQSAEEVEKLVAAALADGGMLSLADGSGRRVIVPVPRSATSTSAWPARAASGSAPSRAVWPLAACGYQQRTDSVVRHALRIPPGRQSAMRSASRSVPHLPQEPHSRGPQDSARSGRNRRSDSMVGTIIGAIIVRRHHRRASRALVLPGKQNISVLVTIVLGHPRARSSAPGSSTTLGYSNTNGATSRSSRSSRASSWRPCSSSSTAT